MRKKSESRKLAELIAKQRGIKVRSAQSWLSRVAAGKVKKPKFELSAYAKRKVKRFVASKQKPAPAPAPTPILQAEPVFKRRVNFDYSGTEIFKAYGTFRHGSAGDIRSRWVRVSAFASDVNDVLNADNIDVAAGIFLMLAPYIEEAIVLELFEFRGRTYGQEFFD